MLWWHDEFYLLWTITLTSHHWELWTELTIYSKIFCFWWTFTCPWKPKQEMLFLNVFILFRFRLLSYTWKWSVYSDTKLGFNLKVCCIILKIWKTFFWFISILFVTIWLKFSRWRCCEWENGGFFSTCQFLVVNNNLKSS